MKNKTYIITEGSNILTTGNMITEGNRYTYKEGSRIGKIILEELIPDPEFLRLKINFYVAGRVIEVSHRKDVEGGYMGMWRIYDESFYEENAEDFYTYENMSEPRAPEITPAVTKAAFLNSLTADQKDVLLDHFNTIYECPALGEHELNIAYLAWLLGEKHVFLSEGFIMNDMNVEFNQDEYEISFENEDLRGGVNLEYTRSYYDLAAIYTKLNLVH